jgi:hypothetical protein
MRASLFLSALALALLAGSPAKAERYYPWCAWYDWSTYNCGFTSYQQCLATIRGVGGVCRPNQAPAPRGRRSEAAPPNPGPVMGSPVAKAGEPARMIQLSNGRWVSTYGCYMDEGYGRYRECNTPDHN